MRLYLLDLPGESGGVLAIVIFNADIEATLESAAPILESIELHSP